MSKLQRGKKLEEKEEEREKHTQQDAMSQVDMMRNLGLQLIVKDPESLAKRSTDQKSPLSDPDPDSRKALTYKFRMPDPPKLNPRKTHLANEKPSSADKN